MQPDTVGNGLVSSPILCVRGSVSVEAEPAVVVPPLDRLAEDGVGHVHRHHLLHGRLVADHVGVELETTQVKMGNSVNEAHEHTETTLPPQHFPPFWTLRDRRP